MIKMAANDGFLTIRIFSLFNLSTTFRPTTSCKFHILNLLSISALLKLPVVLKPTKRLPLNSTENLVSLNR